jgi:hypothetical protein
LPKHGIARLDAQRPLQVGSGVIHPTGCGLPVCLFQQRLHRCVAGRFRLRSGLYHRAASEAKGGY